MPPTLHFIHPHYVGTNNCVQIKINPQGINQMIYQARTTSDMGDHTEIVIADHGNSIHIVNYKDLRLIQNEMEHTPSIRQLPISRYSGTNSYEPLLLFEILFSGIPLFHGTTLWNSFIHYPHSNSYNKDYCRSCVFIIKNEVKCLQNHASLTGRPVLFYRLTSYLNR